MVHALFIVCFGVGAGFVILSFLFGEALGHLGGGADVDASFDGVEAAGDIGGFDTDAGDFDLDAGGIDAGADASGFDADAGDFDAHVHGAGVSPFKPMVIAMFLTVFGGSGLLLDGGFTWFFALPLAIAIGLAAAFCLYRFVYVPLYKYQGRGVVEKQRLVGLTATVTEAIPQGGFGKIKYVADGNVYNAPAKAEDGGGITRGSTVQIMYIEKNAFFVKTKI